MGVAIYGTGKWGKIILKRLEELMIEPKCVFDSNKRNGENVLYI